jgi:endonuclease YncB( thermonuclease family)
VGAAGCLLLIAAFAGGALTGATVASKTAHHAAAASAALPAPDTSTQAPPASIRASYAAEVLRVIDGDTFEARVRIWPGMDVTTKVRLRNIDAPELRARCAEEQIRAEAARDRLTALLAEGDVQIGTVGLDKYGGRVLAGASTRTTSDVSAALLAAGLARPYGGGRRETWCGLARRD